jgi:hypothetical protein
VSYYDGANTWASALASASLEDTSMTHNAVLPMETLKELAQSYMYHVRHQCYKNNGTQFQNWPSI